VAALLSGGVMEKLKLWGQQRTEYAPDNIRDGFSFTRAPMMRSRIERRRHFVFFAAHYVAVKSAESKI
jgi:hypothetical protein